MAKLPPPDEWTVRGTPLVQPQTAGEMQALRATLPVLGAGLATALSQLPGAGRGLFAARAFARGEVVTFYDGPIVAYVRPAAMPARYAMHAAVLVPMRYVILGNHPLAELGTLGRGGAALANHAPPKMNAELTHFDSAANDALIAGGSTELGPYDRLKLLVATRPIAEGEEVLTSYGRDAWQRHARPEHVPLHEDDAREQALVFVPPYKRERPAAEEDEEPPAKRRRSGTPNAEEDEVWRGILLGDYRLHQIGQLTVLELPAYLAVNRELAGLTREAYEIVLRRDFQDPFGGGLYNFARTILDEYRPRGLPPAECYALASATLAWAATAGASLLSQPRDGSLLYRMLLTLGSSGFETSTPDAWYHGRRLPRALTSTAFDAALPLDPLVRTGFFDPRLSSVGRLITLPSWPGLEPETPMLHVRPGTTFRLRYRDADGLPVVEVAMRITEDARVAIRLVAVHVVRLLAASERFGILFAQIRRRKGGVYRGTALFFHVLALVLPTPEHRTAAAGVDMADVVDALRRLGHVPGTLPFFSRRVPVQ